MYTNTANACENHKGYRNSFYYLVLICWFYLNEKKDNYEWKHLIPVLADHRCIDTFAESSIWAKGLGIEAELGASSTEI